MYSCIQLSTIHLVGNLNIIWNDNYNTPYSGNLDLSSVNGTGDGLVYASDGVNENIDRRCELEVKSGEYNASGFLIVIQKGKREVIQISDGQIVGLKGLENVNVLKL